MFRWTTLFAAGALIATAAGAETRQLQAVPAARLTGSDGRTYQIENIGWPLQAKRSPVLCVTPDTAGDRIAWIVIQSPLRHGALGINTRTAETHWIDTTADFGPHAHYTEIIPVGRDTVYVVGGNRISVYKYTLSTRRVKRLHRFPQATGSYWLESHAVGPDGKIYLGTYPRTIVIGIDPATDRVFELPPMSAVPGQMYVNAPAVDDANVLYAPTGKKIPELYALDLKTNRKKQLLSAEQQQQLMDRKCFVPFVWLHDGTVYVEVAGRLFAASADGLAPAPESLVWPEKFIDRSRANSRLPDRTVRPGETALFFSGSGLRIATADGGFRDLPVSFAPVEHELFRFGSVRNGVLYGSGVFRVKMFGLDLKTLTATDYGRCGAGGVQSYDLLDTPQGLLLSSYTGATLDLYRPELPPGPGNPRALGSLEKEFDQERIPRLTRVSDTLVYAGSQPIKGHLNGAVVRIDLDQHAFQVFRGVLPDQSVNDLTLCPDGKTLFGNGSIYGGTGAAPRAKTAQIFLWDIATDRIVWQGAPIDDAVAYFESGVTADGKIITFARNAATEPADRRYYYLVFDPETRRVTARGEIPAQFRRFLISHPEPAGAARRNYFSADGDLYAYDAATGKADKIFHYEGLALSQDMFAAPDGYLYFLTHRSGIERVRLP